MNMRNTSELIKYIGELADKPNLTVTDAAWIEDSCRKTLNPHLAPTLQAQLLFRLAEAVGYTQERRQEAAPHAQRAMELALVANDIVLAVKAYCLNIYCVARHVGIGFSMDALKILKRLFYNDWITRTQPTIEQLRVIIDRIKALEAYLDRLTMERLDELLP